MAVYCAWFISSFFFFFKQKTAYEMRISDWSSDVCSSDLRVRDAAARYIEFCKSTVPSELSLKGLRIALDCAHGANYQVGPAVFAELGAQVINIGTTPDGVNINNGVRSTRSEEHTSEHQPLKRISYHDYSLKNKLQ